MNSLSALASDQHSTQHVSGQFPCFAPVLTFTHPIALTTVMELQSDEETWRANNAARLASLMRSLRDPPGAAAAAVASHSPPPTQRKSVSKWPDGGNAVLHRHPHAIDDAETTSTTERDAEASSDDNNDHRRAGRRRRVAAASQAEAVAAWAATHDPAVRRAHARAHNIRVEDVLLLRKAAEVAERLIGDDVLAEGLRHARRRSPSHGGSRRPPATDDPYSRRAVGGGDAPPWVRRVPVATGVSAAMSSESIAGGGGAPTWLPASTTHVLGPSVSAQPRGDPRGRERIDDTEDDGAALRLQLEGRSAAAVARAAKTCDHQSNNDKNSETADATGPINCHLLPRSPDMLDVPPEVHAALSNAVAVGQPVASANLRCGSVPDEIRKDVTAPSSAVSPSDDSRFSRPVATSPVPCLHRSSEGGSDRTPPSAPVRHDDAMAIAAVPANGQTWAEWNASVVSRLKAVCDGLSVDGAPRVSSGGANAGGDSSPSSVAAAIVSTALAARLAKADRVRSRDAMLAHLSKEAAQAVLRASQRELACEVEGLKYQGNGSSGPHVSPASFLHSPISGRKDERALLEELIADISDGTGTMLNVAARFVFRGALRTPNVHRGLSPQPRTQNSPNQVNGSSPHSV